MRQHGSVVEQWRSSAVRVRLFFKWMPELRVANALLMIKDAKLVNKKTIEAIFRVHVKPQLVTFEVC